VTLDRFRVERPETAQAGHTDEVTNFASTLTIRRAGRRVLTREVRVNQPLAYGVWSLFQASYDPKNPLNSGILIVRDPGQPCVMIGLCAVLLGTVLGLLASSQRTRREGETS